MPAGRDTQTGASGPPGAAGSRTAASAISVVVGGRGPGLLRTALLMWARWRGRL